MTKIGNFSEADIFCAAGGYGAGAPMRMYEEDNEFSYDGRRLVPPSRNVEYRAPPTRNPPPGHERAYGPGHGLGGPRGYDSMGGGGGGSDYDINLLMNISKML